MLGGGGFLGHHLVQGLLEHGGFSVVAVDRCVSRLVPCQQRWGDNGNLQVIESSIADLATVETLVEHSDVVLSLTALCNPALYNTQPVEVIRANYGDLAPLVDLCAQRRRWLVHFSTCEVYGKPELQHVAADVLQEDSSPLVLGPLHRERWTYACAKQLLERLIWACGAHHGLPFTIIRPFNVIGPQMDYLPGVDGEGTPRVLACFMRALLADEPLPLVDGGRRRRSFVEVGDFVEAVIRVLSRPEVCQGEVINLGNPRNDVAIADLAEAMRRTYAARGGSHGAGVRSVSSEQFYGKGYDDVDVRLPDVTKARRLLGWEPTTTLEEMLPRIIDDYVQRYGDRVKGPA